jgi:hypothetical protein
MAGHSPSPVAVVEAARRQHVPPAPRHVTHLATDENLRAVQAGHAALGVAAAGFAFLTLMSWTGCAPVSLAGALLAVGWNPVWIIMYEPSLLSEVLSAFLLVVAMWLVGISSGRSIEYLVISTLCGFAILVRPAMAFAAIPIALFLIGRDGPRRAARAATMMGPLMLQIALLIVFNGMRYGYWGVSSMIGMHVMSHAFRHPAALREPIRHRVENYPGNPVVGQYITWDMVREGVPYLDAGRAVQNAAFHFIVDHPGMYLSSVGGALVEFWTPTLVWLPSEINVVRDRARFLWRGILAGEALLIVGGMSVLLIRAAGGARVAVAVFALSSIGVALIIHTENRRYAASVEPLALMAGAAAAVRLLGKQAAETTQPEVKT